MSVQDFGSAAPTTPGPAPSTNGNAPAVNPAPSSPAPSSPTPIHVPSPPQRGIFDGAPAVDSGPFVNLKLSEIPANPNAAPVVDPAAPPVADERTTQLQALSNQFGYDFSGYASVEDARRTARMIAEQYAQEGFYSQQQAPQDFAPAPVAPQVPAAPAVSLTLEQELGDDLADLPPKVAAVLKRMSEQQAALLQQAEQQKTQVEQQRQVQVKQAQSVIVERAVKAIDLLNSPKYGSGQQRNFPQQLAVQNLFQTAGSIIRGMTARGQQVPVIETVLQMAMFLEGENGTLAAPAPAPIPGQPAPAPVATVTAFAPAPSGAKPAPGRSGVSIGYVPPQHDPLGLFADPNYKSAVTAILQR